MIQLDFKQLPNGGQHAVIVLNNPARSNSLTPEFLQSLNAALDRAISEQAALISLTAEGRNFSTGGDVRRFFEAAQADTALPYAQSVVPVLQGIILKLLSAPAIVICTARGAITGGACGFLFASDLAILSETAFVQPYYREVGFGPDGGWCALLPDLIGARRALSLQLQNTRITADHAASLGLADQTCPDSDLQQQHTQLVQHLDQAADIQALICAKQQIWNTERLTRIENMLAAETRDFMARIAQPTTLAGMQRFLTR